MRLGNRRVTKWSPPKNALVLTSCAALDSVNDKYQTKLKNTKNKNIKISNEISNLAITIINRSHQMPFIPVFKILAQHNRKIDY